MHELSITRNIVTAVSERVGDAQAKRLRLEIGKMSGVVADAVRFCFEIAAPRTAVARSRTADRRDARYGSCRECDTVRDARHDPAVPACGALTWTG